MADSQLMSIEDLFADAMQAARTARKYRLTFRSTEVVRPLPLADTQFFLRPQRAAEKPVADLPRKPSWAVLQFPAPRRMCVKVTDGWWTDQPWTVDGVHATLAAGGWFAKSGHEFADKEAAKAAYPQVAVGQRPATRTLFGDEILQEMWAAQSASLPFKSMQG